MNWDALGAFAELLGAFGVLITLLYLARQIRQNSVSVESATENAISSGFNEINIKVGSDAKLATLMVKGLEAPDELTEDEDIQFTLLWRCYMNHYVQLFALFQQGVLAKDRWDDYAQEAAHMISMPGGKAWRRSNPGMPEFWDELDKFEVKEVLGFRLDTGSDKE